jgi:hypothetical protein
MRNHEQHPKTNSSEDLTVCQPLRPGTAAVSAEASEERRERLAVPETMTGDRLPPPADAHVLSEGEHTFLEFFWPPEKARATGKILDRARALLDRLPGLLNGLVDRADALDKLVARLVSHLKEGPPDVRRAAAEGLSKVFGVLEEGALSLCQLPDEFQPAVPSLIDATADQDPTTRLHVLRTLRFVVYRTAASSIVTALIRNALNDPQGDVVLASLDVLHAAGVDHGSAAVPFVIRLLRHPDPRVRQAACRTLAWFEADAKPAVPEIVDRIADEAHPGPRRELVTALVGIDPDGAVINTAIADMDRRADFLAVLREVGPEARTLRRALQDRWGPLAPRDVVPPGAERVWNKLTEMQRAILTVMWARRDPNGVRVVDLFPLLGWETSLDPDKCLRAHLSNIRKRFRAAKISEPWERRDNRVFWPRHPR